MGRVPHMQPLVFVAAQPLFQLFIGQLAVAEADGEAGIEHMALGAEALEQGAGLLHVAHQHINDRCAHGRLHGVGALVGGHADAQAAGGVLAEGSDSLFDLLRHQPADPGGLLQRVGCAALLQQLIAGLIDHAVPLPAALQGRVKGIVPRVGAEAEADSSSDPTP